MSKRKAILFLVEPCCFPSSEQSIIPLPTQSSADGSSISHSRHAVSFDAQETLFLYISQKHIVLLIPIVTSLFLQHLQPNFCLGLMTGFLPLSPILLPSAPYILARMIFIRCDPHQEYPVLKIFKSFL